MHFQVGRRLNLTPNVYFFQGKFVFSKLTMMYFRTNYLAQSVDIVAVRGATNAKMAAIDLQQFQNAYCAQRSRVRRFFFVIGKRISALRIVPSASAATFLFFRFGQE